MILKVLGFLNHKKTLNILNKSEIAIVPSKWEEPFGRTSLEAASRGCAVIISNRGGLPETITNGVILRKLDSINLYNAISKLIENKNDLIDLQTKSYDNPSHQMQDT